MNLLINCDMGESYGVNHIGNDDALMPMIDQCNIACGFHGGDPHVIENAVDLALAHNVQIGAHPSYNDRAHFGRRYIDMKPNELSALIRYQVAALHGLVRIRGGSLNYVKPHGSLYHAVINQSPEAHIFLQAVMSVDSTLKIMTMPFGCLFELCKKEDVPVIREGFLDRRYHETGQLVSRNDKNAIIHTAVEALEQYNMIATEQRVMTIERVPIALSVDSLCIHGDHANSVEILTHLYQYLRSNIC